jgi:isoquinoline 1-oxidoreductase beta subunit
MPAPLKSSLSLVTRRDFLVAGGAGGVGLLLGIWYGRRKERWLKRVPERSGVLSPSVYLAIEPSGDVVVWVTKSELGQGVWTVLPMVVADELDADWSRVRPVQALASRTYGNQMTAVSSSLRSLREELRDAGAAAREMLVAAAAATWAVDAAGLRTAAGYVVEAATGRRIAYGELVAVARELPVPSAPRRKRVDELRLCGTDVPRLDAAAKASGAARYGIDVRVPGMRFCVLARPPRAGAELLGCDEAAALAVPGVERVLRVARGVAVVARDSWSAQRGRVALAARWSDGPHAAVDSAAITERLQQRLREPLTAVRGVPGAFRGGEVVTAEYELPFLAHAAMEPANATAHVANGRCTIWAPTQHPAGAQEIAMRLLGFAEDRVEVHTTFVGGGFGRRVANVEVEEAVAVAARCPYPVQVLWMREDDLRHDFLRPCSLHRLTAVLDGDRIVSWQHQLATAPIAPPGPIGPDFEGAETMPYAIDEVVVAWGGIEQPLSTGFWRSVGHSHTAFAVESFVDELAQRLDRDPVELRHALLREHPRLQAVLLAAAAAAQELPVAPGAQRGVACHASFGSFVAAVVEAVEDRDGVRATRVVCAVDCGTIVHPGVVRAQVEGGVVWALSAALGQRIDVVGGAVAQSNFHDFPLLRYGRMPEIRVVFVGGQDAPGGVGEIAVPPIAPALAAAVSRLRGERVRKMPIL